MIQISPATYGYSFHRVLVIIFFLYLALIIVRCILLIHACITIYICISLFFSYLFLLKVPDLNLKLQDAFLPGKMRAKYPLLLSLKALLRT